MKTNNLLASVALFRHLYDHDGYNNVYDILYEFIRGAIIYESKITFTSDEIKELLKKVYDFDIPEGVIKTTIRIRFEGKYTKIANSYTFNPELKDNFDKIEKELDQVNELNDNLISKLYKYIAEKKGVVLSSVQKGKIFENFSHFTMDNGYSDEYSELIGAFVVSKGYDTDFLCNLNSIREGIILYQGISYTADLNELGKWDTDLDIFLAPEHLFHAVGYNGLLFQEIFMDLFNLVRDINQGNKPTSKNRDKKVRLFYLPEASIYVNSMFHKAEQIVAGKIALDPSKNAMEHIVRDARSVSDVKRKQVNFYTQLKTLGIEEIDIDFDATKHQMYNVVDQKIITDLSVEAKKNRRPFDEDFCIAQLSIFGKINYKRRGKNNLPFEKISDIYLTENSVSKYLAHNNAVKFQASDTAFAKDIDFVVSRFWFKLKKGFKQSNAPVPKSFDLINKAKIIISAYTNNSISREYQRITNDLRKGRLTEEEVVLLNLELKSKTNAPEYVNETNIDETLDFLTDENFVENVKRERDHVRKENVRKDTIIAEQSNELLEYKRKEQEQRKNELAKEKEKDYLAIAEKEWNEHFKSNRNCGGLFLFVVLIALISVAYGFLNISNEWATWLGKFAFLKNYISAICIIAIVVVGMFDKYYLKDDKVVKGFRWLVSLPSTKRKKAEFIQLSLEKQREKGQSI